MKVLIQLALLGALAVACGGNDDEGDSDGDDEGTSLAGTYSCDSTNATDGHTCYGATYADGMLDGGEAAACDDYGGTYSTRACARPSAGCTCTYEVSAEISADGHAFTGVQVFYFSGAELATADAKERAYLDAAVWCNVVGFRIGSPSYFTTCYGLGAPYDGVHPGSS